MPASWSMASLRQATLQWPNARLFYLRRNARARSHETASSGQMHCRSTANRRVTKIPIQTRAATGTDKLRAASVRSSMLLSRARMGASP
jgi:hypothetical protein